MPAWSRLMPSSAALASMPSLSTPWMTFLPIGTYAVTMPGRQLGAPQTTVLRAVAAGVDHGLHVVAAGDRLHRLHARRAGAGQQLADLLDALALGGLHGDEALRASSGA